MGRVGVVLGIEMSRLARTGRDWHQLLELCSLSGVLLADPDGVYDPGVYNDRLLLGLKGTMSEALCRIRHNASYADSAVMPIMLCECAADLAGSPGESA
jgi:DNA invertase Pin-like site-specific DNA recombinase